MEKRPMLERILQREKDSNPAALRARARRKIGIWGMSSGAGVTLLAFSIARYIANLKREAPALLELSDGDEGHAGWNYDAIGIDKRFVGREYFSYYRGVSEGRHIKDALNMDEGINWALRIPVEADCCLDLQQMTSLINNVAGDITVCDFSSRLCLGVENAGDRDECFRRLLRDMSLIIFVVDPAPSKLLGGAARLSLIKELEHAGANVLYVINKFQRGVNRKEVLGFLKPARKALIGHIAADAIYEAEYGCKNPFQMAQVKEAVAPAIETALGMM
ncbi:MAG: hypothetical protein LBH39_06395 [Clostridiales Family XIII bacterium]|jgi:hypothetical protein|nr:hypothetical protein [Clostridiales Family XIII bacterium]